MKRTIKEEYEVYVKINKIQNNGCFCTFLGLYDGYGFMPQYLMEDHYKYDFCDLNKGDTITACIHEIKSDGSIILSEEFEEWRKEVYARINKIQDDGCFCTLFEHCDGYGFMPLHLMPDHYNNGTCDLNKGDSLIAYIHEIKSDGFIILSDESAFKQKLANEKSTPIEQLSISELRLGIVIGTQYGWNSEKKYIVVLCSDGTLRFIDIQTKSVNSYMEGINANDIVLVEATKTDEVEFVIPLSNFHYYESDYGIYNEIIYNKTNCKIPNTYIEENDFFIFNKGSVFGEPIEGYCRYRKTIYILHNLNYTETNLIRDFFRQNNLKKPKEIIEDIENYLTEENITKKIESFTITNKQFFSHRPGKDDYYYIDKVSKKFEDEYINSLFPNIDETIYEDHGFCSAESMKIDFEERPYKAEECELINEAKKKYNKEEHRVYLFNKYFSESLYIYTTWKENLMMFVNEIEKILLNDVEGFEFGKEYNKLLRNYYKKVNPKG